MVRMGFAATAGGRVVAPLLGLVGDGVAHLVGDRRDRLCATRIRTAAVFDPHRGLGRLGRRRRRHFARLVRQSPAMSAVRA